jgi:hypothetical protein
MQPDLRRKFNNEFSKEKYQTFLDDLNSAHPGAIEFRIAETPVFVPKSFVNKMLDACNSIIDFIIDERFFALTERSIPAHERVANETAYPQMIAFDFGVCTNEDGELVPQLIEMQGFPTLFGFQVMYPELLKKHFEIPTSYSHYLNGYDQESYVRDLKDVLLGGESAENVVLLEIKPHQQKTRIDFYCTEDLTGIRSVCITDIFEEGGRLFYLRDGIKTQIKRIYNRVIFDDLNAQRATLGPHIDIRKPYDVEWVPHPNWFYRVSKYTIPMIRHPYVPATYFLNEIKQLPADLENYVLKPLFSFAGQGVVIDVQKEDIDNVKEPENWILQRKVKYADAVITPDVPAKVEIRMMYLWKQGAERPVPAINLARLSKGKMIGVRYNQDKEWVGGSVCFFEK